MSLWRRKPRPRFWRTSPCCASSQDAALAPRSLSVDLLRLLAQLPAQDLADIGLRQFGPELHQPRDLVGREPRPAVGDQVRFGEVWIFLDDEQLHRLAGARI